MLYALVGTKVNSTVPSLAQSCTAVAAVCAVRLAMRLACEESDDGICAMPEVPTAMSTPPLTAKLPS